MIINDTKVLLTCYTFYNLTQTRYLIIIINNLLDEVVYTQWVVLNPLVLSNFHELVYLDLAQFISRYMNHNTYSIIHPGSPNAMDLNDNELNILFIASN
jgi:hypothetical protein